MRVLGIDPGLADLGWGVVEKKSSARLSCLAHGCIKTSTDASLEQRLLFIYEELQKIILEYKPACAGVEDLFFSKNVSSALPVAHARGVILLSLFQHACQPFTLTPNQIKLGVTGSGSSNKSTIQQMVKMLLQLEKIPKPTHAADALACAIALIHNGGCHV
ncbi:MAG: crossover junction endodeoxyribonuclease RuvC [Spirochaetia bacterium]